MAKSLIARKRNPVQEVGYLRTSSAKRRSDKAFEKRQRLAIERYVHRPIVQGGGHPIGKGPSSTAAFRA